MFAGADHRIEAFADDVRRPVGGIQFQLDLRMKLFEGSELRDRHHAQ